MAKSTGIVVTAGAIGMADLILTGWDASAGVKLATGTVLAAFVSAGLDEILPGLGTGAAVLLLVAVVYRNGPHLAAGLFTGGAIVGQQAGIAASGIGAGIVGSQAGSAASA